MTKQLVEQQPTMDNFLVAMKGKAEELLTKFFVGKTFDGEPWAEEHFEVTMQVIVDVTVANTDVADFNINTSIEDHILFMNVQDNQGNTVADVLYFVTKDEKGYTIDGVQVAFKLGAFVAPKEEEVTDELPF
jgi:hypothetical protein